MKLEQALVELLKHEGGYSKHPLDPGGETMYGITARVARANGYTGAMKEMPMVVARDIYRKLYWDKIRAEEIPVGLRYALLDASVNSGVSQAIRWLQRAVGAQEDGLMGIETISRARAIEPDLILRRMLGYRLDMMTSINGWSSFGKGWARRIAKILTM